MCGNFFYQAAFDRAVAHALPIIAAAHEQLSHVENIHVAKNRDISVRVSHQLQHDPDQTISNQASHKAAPCLNASGESIGRHDTPKECLAVIENEDSFLKSLLKSAKTFTKSPLNIHIALPAGSHHPSMLSAIPFLQTRADGAPPPSSPQTLRSYQDESSYFCSSEIAKSPPVCYSRPTGSVSSTGLSHALSATSHSSCSSSMSAEDNSATDWQRNTALFKNDELIRHCPVNVADLDLGSHAMHALRLFAVSESPEAMAYVLQCMEVLGIDTQESHLCEFVRCVALSGDLDRLDAVLSVIAHGRIAPSIEMWTHILTAYHEHHVSPTSTGTSSHDLYQSQAGNLNFFHQNSMSRMDRIANILTLFMTYSCVVDILKSALTACRQNQYTEEANFILRFARNEEQIWLKKEELLQGCNDENGQGGVLDRNENCTHTKHYQFFNETIWVEMAWTHALCKDPHAILKLMEDMYDIGLKPGVDIFAFLLMAYGRTFELDTAISIFRDIEKDNKHLSETMFICMLDALAHNGQPHEARELLNYMERLAIPPSLTAYNKLVKAYAHSRNPQGAASVVQAMHDQSITPNETTYRCWMYGHALCKDPAGAEICLDRMISDGHHPSAQTFNVLLYAYALAGELPAARAVIDRLIEAGERPLTVSFNVLGNGYGRQHNLEGLHNLVKDMASAKISPNLVTYNTLIKSFCMNHQIKKAENILSQMIQRGIKGDISTWGALAGAYARNGNIEDLLLTFRRCIAGGTLPNRRMFDMVVFLLTRSSINQKNRQRTISSIAHMIIDACQRESSCSSRTAALIQHCYRTSNQAF